MKNSNLYKKILDSTNIYNAIYSLESYIFEKGLLEEKDLLLFNNLSDKYNYALIKDVINECQILLQKILNNPDELFEINVFFKLKKYNKENDTVAFRPIHSANLITQICIVCLLNQIMYNDNFNTKGKLKNKKCGRRLSEISNLIPSNFYGNIPSVTPELLFIPWKQKYKEYTEIVIDKYYEYKDNKSYKNEVCLDIENFYPTVNPIIIYNFIIDKLSPSLKTKGEIKCLKTITYKLLYFKLKNFNTQWYKVYYDLDSPDDMPKILYNKGIPQGLPQAYFFSNLCMTEIAKSVNKIFNGDAYYYVDDSVIYTNNAEEKFDSDLKELNEDIQHRLERYKMSEETIIPKNILDVHNKFYYSIKIHENHTKSTITPIDDAYYGLANLKAMAGIASNVGFNIYNTIDEDEDTTLLDKVEIILKGIDKEIERVNLDSKQNDSKPTEYYKKFLRRYKRFFLFRRKVLELKKQQDYENIIEKFFSKYIENVSSVKKIEPKVKEAFFERFDEDIFAAEIRLILDSLKSTDHLDRLNDFVNNIYKLEKLLVANSDLPIENNQLYFQKDMEGAKKIIYLFDKKYESLSSYVKQNLQSFDKSSNDFRISTLLDFLKEEQLKKTIEIKSYSLFIYNISNEFKRKILNCLFSHVTSLNINDEYIFLKSDYRTLMYYELRLIAYLRNKYFIFNEFISFATEILENINDELSIEKADYHIFEVLHIFHQRVKTPKRIDSLILIHKLVNGLWKNGSRFLHFYTLHNEEHSLELIKKSIKISNSIDYFNLKDIDYYILFLSCYLHDISMVIHPNLDSFYKDIYETNIIYTSWLCDAFGLQMFDKQGIKKHILDYFKKVYNYFETNVRTNHHKLSAKFIIDKSETKYLNFIEKSILQIVANVSEAHQYDSDEVYGRKSFAKRDIFSIKYLMIILRMADLLDMSKDRVSYYILKENIKHMEPISQFHWISHYITEKCDIKSKYEIKETAVSTESYLRKIGMKEIIEIDIYLNIKQLTSVKCPNCTKITSDTDIDNDKISISIYNEEKKCLSSSCPFICKWMVNKNYYLFSELFELNKYLERVNHGLFSTEFKVNLYYSDNKRLEPEFMDIINDYIDNE